MFRAAARHSRFVRFLRMAIPGGIAAVAATIVIATFFNPFRMIAKFPIDPGKVTVSGTRIVMESPRLNGFSTDGRPYELIARTAVQDVTKPDLLELSELVAHVDQKDGQHVDIQSVSGLYNTKSELLKLNDRIVLTTSSGYEAYLSEATVTVGTGLITSENPVAVKLPNGWLNSQRLEVIDNGALMRFGGGVEMTLNPEPQASRSTSAAATGTTTASSGPGAARRSRTARPAHRPAP